MMFHRYYIVSCVSCKIVHTKYEDLCVGCHRPLGTANRLGGSGERVQCRCFSQESGQTDGERRQVTGKSNAQVG